MAQSGKSTEGVEILQGLPDFMLERMAESMSEVMEKHPDVGAVLQGKQEPDMKEVLKALAEKQGVLEWYEKSPAEAEISDQQIKRDGSNLLCRRGKERFEKGLFPQATILFRRAVEIDEKNADAWLGLADALAAQGKDGESEEARARGHQSTD